MLCLDSIFSGEQSGIFPSGKWSGYYTHNNSDNSEYGFQTYLTFSKTQRVNGTGNDNNLESWNKDGFEINGQWDVNRITFKKSYIGGNSVFYLAALDSDDKTKMTGQFSFSPDGPNAGGFYMTFVHDA